MSNPHSAAPLLPHPAPSHPVDEHHSSNTRELTNSMSASVMQLAKRKSEVRLDGRRNNKPPEAGQIKPKEVRNPHGRRGKPKPSAMSDFDKSYLAAASRIVYSDANGPVDALNRLIQEEVHRALKGDERARERVLQKCAAILASQAATNREALEWAITCKCQYSQDFAFARRTQQLPPDVFHPDHVLIEDDQIRIIGPIDEECREQWEWLKARIKVTAYCHARARAKAKADPSPENLEYLSNTEVHRRQLMRCVPKGWNWREDIYCRHSQTAFVNEVICRFKEIDDARA
jgi:hypothetical protein